MTLAAGARIEFLGFGEPDPHSTLEPGTRGSITFVDDSGTVHVRWDDGSTIGLVQRPMHDGDSGFKPDRYRLVAE